MSDSKPIASLSPTLLARKGGAKPAMRQFEESAALKMQAELGWNDMGEPDAEAHHEAEIYSITGDQSDAQAMPEVLRQQKAIVDGVGRKAAERRSALAEGRRAAFTLRIDADRHLKLRLASTVTNRSAQQLVTEALDAFLEAMPDLDALAAKIRKRS